MSSRQRRRVCSILGEHCRPREHNTDPLNAGIAIVGAGMAGLMTFVGRTALTGIRNSVSNRLAAVFEHERLPQFGINRSRPKTRRVSSWNGQRGEYMS